MLPLNVEVDNFPSLCTTDNLHKLLKMLGSAAIKQLLWDSLWEGWADVGQ